MKNEKGKDHRVHIEFAHFSRLDFFSLFDQYVVKHADSLGMNEQEMIMLLEFWSNQIQDINQARESKPSFDDIIMQLKIFFQVAKEKKIEISRVHLHPYGSFFLCYDKSKWEDGRDAILKSALTTPKYCVNTETLEDHLENFDVPEMPLSFIHPNKPDERIWTNKSSLTYKFDLNDDVECYLQFFLKCRSMLKTAGMGDTISSTGFIYHAPKKNI